MELEAVFLVGVARWCSICNSIAKSQVVSACMKLRRHRYVSSLVSQRPSRGTPPILLSYRLEQDSLRSHLVNNLVPHFPTGDQGW